jgi:hypothetical protein
MKSGSTWYSLATGSAAATAQVSLAAALNTVSSVTGTTGVTGLTAGVEYDIYRVIVPATGATLTTRTLVVGADDVPSTSTGVKKNTLVVLTKLIGADEINISSAGNIGSEVQLLFYTGEYATASTAAPWMQTLSDTTNSWVAVSQADSFSTNNQYYRMGSKNWLYKMKVVNKGAPTNYPRLTRKQADNFSTLSNLSAVGAALNLVVTRGLILEEASRGELDMGTDGKITIKGLDATLNGTAKGYVVRENSSAATPLPRWHPIHAGEVSNGSGTPSTTAFDYNSGSQDRKASGSGETGGTLTGDSGNQWAPTPTWAVFYLEDISGTSGDTTVTLGGLDTAINFTGLKYEQGTPAVAKTGGAALYGAILNMSSAATADFDVAVNLGAANPLGAAITTSSSLSATDAEYTALAGPTTSAVVFNDTKSAGTSMVSYQQTVATETYFTMTIKANTPAAFTTKIVPAPEDLAILPTVTGTTPVPNYVLTLTAAGPGEWMDTISAAACATSSSPVKWPKYTSAPAATLENWGLAPSVGVRSSTKSIAKFYWAGASVPTCADICADGAGGYGIAKSILKRKTTKVTSGWTSS